MRVIVTSNVPSGYQLDDKSWRILNSMCDYDFSLLVKSRPGQVFRLDCTTIADIDFRSGGELYYVSNMDLPF